MRLRFKSALTFIFLLIVVCICLEVGYLFYVKVIKDDAIVVVDGNITINYLNGNEFAYSNDGSLEFSVTNNSDEKAFYYIQFSDLKGNSSNVTYEIISSTNDVNLKDQLKADIVSHYIPIDANKTDSYTVFFKTESKDNYSGRVVVGIKQNEDDSFSSYLLANHAINELSMTSSMENATLDEGLIKTKDDLGDAYYFRGKVENNYVSFGNFIWRIVKINGDGSVKLVLNGITDVLSKYYDDANTFEESMILNALDTWYSQSGLINYADYIANYKYCNDLVYDENVKKYAAYDRIMTNKIPTFMCLGSTLSTKVGLLTVDEVVLAGASTSENKDYYLYNETIETDYYTMTSAKSNNGYFPFIVKTNGAISDSTNGTLIRGVRPVINVVRDVKVVGTGTKDDPYVISVE